MPSALFRLPLIIFAGIASAAPAFAADLPAASSPESRPADAKPAGPAAETKAAEGKSGGKAKATKKDVVSALADFAWLEGCWRGSVNEREFREHWLPLRGNLMIGVSHTVRGGSTQDYEYLRLEPRADGVYYVDQPSGQKAKENAFRFAERKVDTADGRNDEIFTFARAGDEFPQRILYRRGSEGWLYASVEGKVGGADKSVIYPMRRIDCQSGEFIRK